MSITIQIIENNKESQSIANYIDNGRDFNVIARNNDEIKAYNFTTQNHPDVILLGHDVRNNGTDQFIQLLLEESPQSKILIIGDDLSQEQVISCLMSGAIGHIAFKSLKKFINKAIKVVAQEEEAWVSRKMTAVLLKKLRN